MRFKYLLNLTFVFVLACSGGEKLGESEVGAIHTIFTTGTSFERDPYVRAESMRVIELLADPTLAAYATDGVRDDVPMVRLAALRALLASNAPEASTSARYLFERSNAEQRAVLTAVAEYGSGPQRRGLLSLAMTRSTDPELLKFAFESDLLQRVDEAAKAGDDDALRNHLFPELGRYVGVDRDPVLASLAVRKFLALGQTDRIASLLRTLGDERAPLNNRVSAARILMGAHSPEVAPAFQAILDRYDEVMNEDTLGVPDQVIPPPLLRMAVLGLVASGDTGAVKRAQVYFNNVGEAEAVEVLSALGENSSPDAAVTLKVAMQDSRRDVRLRAIDLYQRRADADAQALIAAIKGADYETQKKLAAVLLERFPDQWVTALERQLLRSSEIDRTLEQLRDVVTNEAEAQTLLVPLRDVLAEHQNGDPQRAALAAYLIAVSSPDTESTLMAETLDPATRYAYLEYLVRTQPERHVPTFRKYLYDDLFVVRLMSAAGLWRVLGAGVAQ